MQKELYHASHMRQVHEMQKLELKQKLLTYKKYLYSSADTSSSSKVLHVVSYTAGSEQMPCTLQHERYFRTL